MVPLCRRWTPTAAGPPAPCFQGKTLDLAEGNRPLHLFCERSGALPALQSHALPAWQSLALPAWQSRALPAWQSHLHNVLFSYYTFLVTATTTTTTVTITCATTATNMNDAYYHHHYRHSTTTTNTTFPFLLLKNDFSTCRKMRCMKRVKIVLYVYYVLVMEFRFSQRLFYFR